MSLQDHYGPDFDEFAYKEGTLKPARDCVFNNMTWHADADSKNHAKQGEILMF